MTATAEDFLRRWDRLRDAGRPHKKAAANAKL